MELKQSDIQKQRIKEIEDKASLLVDQAEVIYVSSVTELGYPRTCVVGKIGNDGFRKIYFCTSKRSNYQGKAKHFEENNKASVCCHVGHNSLTLVGIVERVTDQSVLDYYWKEEDKGFFPKGNQDPKYRLYCFNVLEATFWIDHKFRTVKYRYGDYKL